MGCSRAEGVEGGEEGDKRKSSDRHTDRQES
ncbi:hypothetical protein CAEBREN_02547 [Caenorhabditis brenneri]|uniref:Uncharacterized protein n=1 Tax=Caenorhabditis brenneri TaxID=135651 RepID=G0PN22_CAEBE|nr:hypothetical protein CAEBREN_02547 [Caenorhabditis brenneri]